MKECTCGNAEKRHHEKEAPLCLWCQDNLLAKIKNQRLCSCGNEGKRWRDCYPPLCNTCQENALKSIVKMQNDCIFLAEREGIWDGFTRQVKQIRKEQEDDTTREELKEPHFAGWIYMMDELGRVWHVDMDGVDNAAGGEFVNFSRATIHYGTIKEED